MADSSASWTLPGRGQWFGQAYNGPAGWGGVTFAQGDTSGQPLSPYHNLVDQYAATRPAINPLQAEGMFNRWNFLDPAARTTIPRWQATGRGLLTSLPGEGWRAPGSYQQPPRWMQPNPLPGQTAGLLQGRADPGLNPYPWGPSPQAGQVPTAPVQQTPNVTAQSVPATPATQLPQQPTQQAIPAQLTPSTRGLDSIFANGRDPTTAELQAYAKRAGQVPVNTLTDMLGTAFMSPQDAQAYKAYMIRLWGDPRLSSTPDY